MTGDLWVYLMLALLIWYIAQRIRRAEANNQRHPHNPTPSRPPNGPGTFRPSVFRSAIDRA